MIEQRPSDLRQLPLPSPGRAPAATLRTLALAPDRSPLPVLLIGAALCLAVGLIHLQDQGGLLGDESPSWIAIGYYLVEVTAAVTIPFLLRQRVAGWFLGAGISAGPSIAYLLSRTVGLPGDPGDVGNWNYTLGTVSLIVEGALFALSMFCILRIASRVVTDGRAADVGPDGMASEVR